MNTLASESDLLRCFREIDRPEVELAADLAFPLAFDDVFAWAVGPRAYLVFRDRATAPPRGHVFHRGNGGVKLMSVNSDQRRRVGLYLCSDLGCVARARAVPAPDDVPERVDGDERARRVVRRIAEFAARRLF
jgi:hypothetical protein